MKVLLVSPEFPVTFMNLKYTSQFTYKETQLPPMGLLTVAAMLPRDWEKKLIDMDIDTLNDSDLKRADYVFISAMCIQRESAKRVISRCKKLGVKIVAGGPLFTTEYEDFPYVDHLVLNEAEITLTLFLTDLKRGCAKHIYTANKWADVRITPIPLWELIDMKRYAQMGIQYSRGCPFNCEFCDVTVLYGRKPRVKDAEQILAELENLYISGWKGSICFLDDNFIGNKRKLKEEILPAIINWQEKRGRPFYFFTQASIDLSDDDELIELMVRASFFAVLIGFETPHNESLTECGKLHNLNHDITACVKKIHRRGIMVLGSFLLGFDHDPPWIFDVLISLIQKSGIVIASICLLSPLRGTRLYQRMRREGRLVKESTGGFIEPSTNFIPKMGYQILTRGYTKVINNIYSPENYYRRIVTFLKDYKPVLSEGFRLRFKYLVGGIKSMAFLGMAGKGRWQYWKLIFWCLFRYPRMLPLAMLLAIDGFHFRKYYKM